ncbi:helix-turn-helix domain-containing protein [Nocardia rhamnosiphila]|uniref:Helix-turn-helix transcriptional regulator n=1 Tax=Nocardia rhamnosiphila TaxID=426716 RepID=A0ABV2WZ30_9NOCA
MPSTSETPPAKATKAPKNPLGATGRTVAKNVERLRKKQGLQYTELAARLEEIGRPIPTLGLRHIEASRRRVDADDLVALAVALRTTPNALLLPPTDDPQHLVEITGSPNETGASVWKWANGERPLPVMLSVVPGSVPKENRYTYAKADFENNSVPAIQNWTDQPNITVGPLDGNDGDD